MTYKKHMEGIHWPLKVFWYFIEVAITNAHYILMKITNSKNTLREFCEQLSTQLVGNRSYCKRKPCTAAGDKAIRFNSSLPHAPQENPKRRCAIHVQCVAFTCAWIHVMPDTIIKWIISIMTQLKLENQMLERTNRCEEYVAALSCQTCWFIDQNIFNMRHLYLF